MRQAQRLDRRGFPAVPRSVCASGGGSPGLRGPDPSVRSAGVAWDAKVLTVSDSLQAGLVEDRSGPALVALLDRAGFRVVEQSVVSDGVGPVADALRTLTGGFAGLVVSTGGTGFAPRDLTPEATLEVIERQAPALAEAMHGVSPKARLSRGVAGTLGRCLVLNVPGSPAGAVECLGAVIDVVPHALALLAGDDPHPHDHPRGTGGDEDGS